MIFCVCSDKGVAVLAAPVAQDGILASSAWQLWNLVADGAAGAAGTSDSGTPVYSRQSMWSYAAARLLLSLRQSDYSYIVIRDEMVDKVLKWVRSDTLPQRCYGAGLLLCTLPDFTLPSPVGRLQHSFRVIPVTRCAPSSVSLSLLAAHGIAVTCCGY